jgi:invasion protein IalB
MTNRLLPALMMATATVLCVPAVASAQQQPAAKPAAKPAPKPAPKPAQAAPQAPAAQQAPQAAPGQQDMPKLVYQPWMKICDKTQDPQPKTVCLTGRNGATEQGQPVLGLTLIEPEDQTKLFRVSLPSPIQLGYGTRIAIDNDQPLTGQFFTCLPVGLCLANFEATPDFIGKLKKGTTLSVKFINIGGNEISFAVPLADFAKANEGPATDPKVLEEQSSKLQSELQKRADEARKKLESQQPKQ